MTINSLLTALDEVKLLLSEANILKYENTSRARSIVNTKLSAEFLSIMYSDDYDNIYKTAMKNNDFDFVLFDDSFIQFSAIKGENDLSDGKIRYAYFPNSRSYQTYVGFLEENEMTYEDAGDTFTDEYEQYISEAKLKDFVTPIRYDYDYSSYDMVNHSISHLHIGREENIRIPLSKVLSPQAFTIFIIKNLYLEYWKKAILNDSFKHIFEKSKQKCTTIEEELFAEFEKLQLYLS